MSALGNLVVSLALDTAAFTKGVDKSSYEAQKFAQDLDRTLNRSLGAAKQSFIGFGSAALGAIGVVTSVTEAISRLNASFIKLDGLAKDSQRFGIPVEQLSQLQYAADMSGVQIDKLGDSLKDLLKNVSEAANGVKGQSSLFRALGVDVVDASGKVRGASELMEDLAEVFSSLDDGATKTNLAMKVFGESGKELIPLLNAGRDGIRQLNDEANRFGAVVGTDAAKAAEVYQDNLSRLSVSFNSLFKSTASSLLPALVSITGEMANATAAAGSLGGGVQVLINDFVNLGSPAQKIQDLNKELIEAKENLETYGGVVGQFFAGKQVAAIESQIRYNKGILDAQIADAVKPPATLPDGTETAATKQKRENEQREKKERDDRIKQVLAEGEAAKRLAEQRQREAEQRRKQLDMERQYAELMKQIGQQNQSYESLVQYLDEHDDYLKAKEEETRALERELQEVGLSEQALASLRAERLREIATLKEATAAKESDTFAAEKLRKEAEELRKQAELGTQIFSAQAAEKESKKAAEEAKKAFESITGDIASAITNGIADGSIEGMDFIKRLFKTTVVRVGIEPFIKGAVGSLFGALGLPGVANAQGLGDLASAAGNLKSLYDGVTSTFTNLSGSLESAGDFLAKTFYNSSDAVADFGLQLGDFASTNASAINTVGSALGALGTVYAGFKIGRTISGGYSLNGGTGNSTVNIGTAIGAAIAGPLGAALGAIAGGTFNRLFGRKQVLGASGIQGEFTQDGFAGQAFQDVTLKGGLFRSSKSFTQFSGIAQEALDLLAESTQALGRQVTNVARTVGVDATETLNEFVLAGRFSISTNEQVTATLKAVADAMVGAAIPALKEFQRQGESLLDTAVRVSSAVTSANQAAISLGRAALFALNNAEAAESLLVNLGESGLANLQFFFDNFVPEADRTARQASILTMTIRQLGLESKVSTETTREQFQALIQGFSLTTDASQRELAALLSIAPALDALIDRREQEANAVDGLSLSLGNLVKQISESAVEAIGKQISMSKKAADQARDSANSYKLLSESLRTAARGVLGMAASDQVGVLRQQYQATFSQAGTGDQKALGRLSSEATAYLNAFKETAASGFEFSMEAAKIANQLEQSAALAEVLGVGADFQAKLFEVQTAALELVQEQLQAGNLTVETLQQHTALLENIGQQIIASAQLNVGVTTDAAGKTIGALFDSSGLVVGQLANETVLNLQGLVNQAGLISSGFNNSITGQTAQLGGLTQDQISKLQTLNSVQSQALGLTDIVAAATDGSETLLGAVLVKLGQQDTGSANIVASLKMGNIEITNYLSEIAAALKQQSEAAAAEAKRVQDLAKAQSDLSAINTQRNTAIAGVQQGIQNIRSLESQVGASTSKNLYYEAFEQAIFKINDQGLFEADFDSIFGNFTAFKNAFYAPGGAFDQTYGQASQLQSLKDQLEAQRQLVISLGGIPQFSTGGLVNGPGTSTSDSIMARLSNGEYVMPAETVGRFGVSTMDSIRAGRLPMAMGSDRGSEAVVAELRMLRQQMASLEERYKIIAGQTLEYTKRTSENVEDIADGDVSIRTTTEMVGA